MSSRHEPQSPPAREHSAGDLPEGVPEPGSAPPEAASPESEGVMDEYTEALEDIEDRWRRAVADRDNLRKRYARELAGERRAERENVLAALLPVLDHLELALDHAGADPDSIVEGVEAVRDQAVGVFQQLGYPRQEETGVPFDPRKHEVVGVVEEPDTEPGTVVGVRRPGYGGPERQLRPMAVTVSKPRE